MKKPSKSAAALKQLIHNAIQDSEVTPEEYRQIMACADDDAHLDDEERSLLSQFHELLSSGAIRRVAG
jgi:hypothetical protein